MDYIKKQNKITNVWVYDVDLSFIRLLGKFINHFIAINNIEIFIELLSAKGRLWNYKFSQNAGLIEEALTLFKSLIMIKSVPIVQEVYNTLLLDAESSFVSILSCQDDTRKTETSILFDLCIFAELGDNTHV